MIFNAEQDRGFSVTKSDETWVITSNGFTGV